MKLEINKTFRKELRIKIRIQKNNEGIEKHNICKFG
jgi:hypothetical protein